MTYAYIVRIQFIKGNKRILKDYKVDFIDLPKLFVFLENKHKDNYILLSIKKLKQVVMVNEL